MTLQRKKQDSNTRLVRKRHGPSTENKILNAAEELFALYGFDAVTTKQIAVEAGVANGAVYHHFSSKEVLYAAVIKRVFAKKSTLPQQLINSTEPPEHKMVQLVTWFARLVIFDKNFGLLLRREMLDPRPGVPSFVDEGLFKDSLNMFKVLVLQVEPQANADEAVASTLALIFGFSSFKGIYTFFPGVRKTLETPEEIALYATRTMLRGLKA